MDEPNTTIEKPIIDVKAGNVEIPTSANVGVEATPIAEILPAVQSPVDSSPSQTNETVVVDPSPVVKPENDDQIDAAELTDLTSSAVENADTNWTNRVKEVIRDDAGKPAKEEDDAESLNEEYMKARFNVDVDAPIEEK